MVCCAGGANGKKKKNLLRTRSLKARWVATDTGFTEKVSFAIHDTLIIHIYYSLIRCTTRKILLDYVWPPLFIFSKRLLLTCDLIIARCVIFNTASMFLSQRNDSNFLRCRVKTSIKIQSNFPCKLSKIINNGTVVVYGMIQMSLILFLLEIYLYHCCADLSSEKKIVCRIARRLVILQSIQNKMLRFNYWGMLHRVHLQNYKTKCIAIFKSPSLKECSFRAWEWLDYHDSQQWLPPASRKYSKCRHWIWKAFWVSIDIKKKFLVLALTTYKQ